MNDDRDRNERDGTQRDSSEQSGSSQPGSGGPDNADPLGIIGWVVGGKYKITSHLGGGGFGEIYHAHNVNLPEQRLVVKFFKRVQARDRFDREAKVLCLLDHPNINKVVDYLPDEGALVIQFIDGKDGAQILKESGPIDSDVFLKIARSVSDAIAYAHEKKIAHRDIKPHNIIVDRNGHVQLIDFGIAKEVGGDATRTGYQALTPMFAAPERQTGGKDYNPFLSDIYELGITLYNFLTNSMPYRNPVQPNINEWGGPAAAGFSPELRRVLQKATHPNPDKRHQTARELANDLQSVSTVYAAKRKRTLGIVAALVVIAAGIVGGVMFWPKGEIASPPDKAAAVEPGNVSEEQTDPGNEALGTNGSTSRETEDGVQAQGEAAITGEVRQPENDNDQSPAEPGVGRREETQEEAAEPPPPPPPPEMVVRVTPSGVHQVLVDDRPVTAGSAFQTREGAHDITIVHPDFPLYRDRIRASGAMTDRTFDLRQIFGAASDVDAQLGVVPPSDLHALSITLNGRTHTFTNFPVLDFSIPGGAWQIEVDINPLSGDDGSKPIVDSVVTHPFDADRRAVLRTSEGLLELTADATGSVVPLLVFWSSQ